MSYISKYLNLAEELENGFSKKEEVLLKEMDNKTIISVSVQGIDKKDLILSIKSDTRDKYLSIVGSTKDKIMDKEYKINSKIYLTNPYFDLSKVEPVINNGILYITIPVINKKEEDRILNIL